jgi:hypothetical protein
MKKFTLFTIVIVTIFMSRSLFAQESGSGSLFHFGLKAAPALSWFAPGDKKFTNNGSRLGFGYGLITEFGFTKNYAFSTGLEVLNAGGKLGFPKSPDSTYCAVLNEDVTPSRTDTFLLQERTYRLRYVNLPLLLKLKTNQIGSMTYFGQFGFDVSFKWKATSDDDGYFKGSQSTTRNDVDISNDVNFIRLALNVGLGAEYNLTGSTSLVCSINYNNGFTNALRKDSKTLSLYKIGKKSNALVQNAVFNYVALTVGILF